MFRQQKDNSLFFFLFFPQFWHKIAHNVKEVIRKGLLKLKPAVNWSNVFADMSKLMSVPREKRVLPITPEKFTIGLYPFPLKDPC